MAELNQTALKTLDMTATYDERRRTFDRLRNLSLSDPDLKQAIEDYKNANRAFEKAKAELLK